MGEEVPHRGALRAADRGHLVVQGDRALLHGHVHRDREEHLGHRGEREGPLEVIVPVDRALSPDDGTGDVRYVPVGELIERAQLLSQSIEVSTSGSSKASGSVFSMCPTRPR